MRNLLLTLPALLLLAGACDKQALRDGASTLNVQWAEVATKGAATDAEKKVNTLWFFVFDANGMLEIAHECTGAEMTARQAGLTVKTGAKTVYAVANLTGAPLTAAKACLKASELEAVAVDLSDHSTTGFVMVARGTVNVSAASGGSCSLSLERLVAKVSLGTVTNALPAPYGAVKVKRRSCATSWATRTSAARRRRPNGTTRTAPTLRTGRRRRRSGRAATTHRCRPLPGRVMATDRASP